MAEQARDGYNNQLWSSIAGYLKNPEAFRAGLSDRGKPIIPSLTDVQQQTLEIVSETSPVRNHPTLRRAHLLFVARKVRVPERTIRHDVVTAYNMDTAVDRGLRKVDEVIDKTKATINWIRRG